MHGSCPLLLVPFKAWLGPQSEREKYQQFSPGALLPTTSPLATTVAFLHPGASWCRMLTGVDASNCLADFMALAVGQGGVLGVSGGVADGDTV